MEEARGEREDGKGDRGERRGEIVQNIYTHTHTHIKGKITHTKHTAACSLKSLSSRRAASTPKNVNAVPKIPAPTGIPTCVCIMVYIV
jgi:hypothetical protein